MTQRNHSAENPSHQPEPRCLSKRRFASTLPAQSLCWLGSISLLGSGGLVFAQTESSIDNIVPTVENQQPASETTVKKATIESSPSISAPESPGVQPEFSQRKAKLRQRLSRSKTTAPAVVIRKSTAQVEDSSPTVSVRRSRRPQVEISVPTTTARKLRTTLRATRKTPVISTENTQLEAAPPGAIVREEKPQQAVSQQSYSSANSTPNKDYNNAYIDPSDYRVGATDKYEAPNSVVITERSGGCKTIVEGVSNLCGKAPVYPYRHQRLADSDNQLPRKHTPTWLRRSRTSIATVPQRRVTNAVSNAYGRPSSRVAAGVLTNTLMRPSSRIASSGVSKSTYNSNRFIPRDFTPTTTVSSSPIAPAGGALPPPVTAENVAPRPSLVAYNIPLASTLPRIAYSGVYAGRDPYRGTGLMYPLSVPSPITSLFGWRTHPITGNRRFHAGTDIGAAMGTPVLAAYSGQVETADWLGGYGLAVVLNHNNAQQTLYGHMSEILVQPGQWVEQGTVIGRVGSTGNSTGPHLHFEVRQLTPEGWVATDPGAQLEYGFNQLIQSLQTAQGNQQSGS